MKLIIRKTIKYEKGKYFDVGGLSVGSAKDGQRATHSDVSSCKSSHVNAPLPGCIALNDKDDGDDNDIDSDDDDDDERGW